MLTPVLIAARNEATALGRTLEALPEQTEPIVIPNGCMDTTATIAEGYGAKVIHGASEGKLPALQAGLRSLGDRALEPLIVLDADTVPLFPSRWLARMLGAAEVHGGSSPIAVSGSVFYGGINPVLALYRDIGHWKNLLKNRHQQNQGITGGNLLLQLYDQGTLEQILGLPNFWPRDDTAIRDSILAHNGTSVKLLHPAAAALTDGSRFPSLLTRLRLGHERTWQGILDSYLAEAAPGSTPYESLPPTPSEGTPTELAA